MQKKTLTIITIVRNGVEYIEETIKSVLKQKISIIEYIVIDGNSKDGTIQIINKYRDQIDIIVSEPDMGIYDAINKGLNLATGELIGLIHCGDMLNDGALQLCYQKYIESPKEIIYGDITILEEIDDYEIKSYESANHLLLKKKMSIFHPSTFISKECYSKYGVYDIGYKIAADYDLLLRCYTRGASFEYIPVSLTTFRTGGASSDSVKLTKELFRIWISHLGIVVVIMNTLFRLSIFIFFNLRKKLATMLIGKSNYEKLKVKKYRQYD